MSNASISIVDQKRDYILGRIRQGDPLTDIARDIGYSDHSGIVHRLADDPAYKHARKVSLEARLEKRTAEMEAAEDNVTVSRVRELLKVAMWRAEREAPDQWGARQVIEHRGEMDMGAAVEEARRMLAGRRAALTIDAEVAPSNGVDDAIK